VSEIRQWTISTVWRMGWLVVPLGLSGCKEPPMPSDMPSTSRSATDANSVAPTNSQGTANTNSAVATAPPPHSSPRPPSGPATTVCVTDADCVVTNFPGCCACPQCSKGPPRALTAPALAEEQDSCQTVKCDLNRCALAGMCPPGEDASKFVGRCRASECVLERK
jgi:hypothetical protein